MESKRLNKENNIDKLTHISKKKNQGSKHTKNTKKALSYVPCEYRKRKPKSPKSETRNTKQHTYTNKKIPEPEAFQRKAKQPDRNRKKIQ